MISKLLQLILLTIVFIIMILPVGLIYRAASLFNKKRNRPASYLLPAEPLKQEDMEEIF